MDGLSIEMAEHQHGYTIVFSISRRFIFQTIFACVAVSVLTRVILPSISIELFSNTKLLCETEILNHKFKTYFNCENGNDNRLKSLRRQNHILYFEEPIPLQQWWQSSDDQQDYNDKGEVIISQQQELPFENSELKIWREAEAKIALQAAKRSRSDGNLKRAKQIIEHAYSLAPHHPDILTEYGIFLETAQNIVGAEGFYRRALANNPHHAEALTRRERTLPLVEEIDNKMLNEINRKRELFLKIPRNDAAFRRSMRESYFQHVYHTVAMEGNTFSLIQTRSVLETRMAVAGKSILEHNEIIGMDAALRFLNQTLSDTDEIRIEHILDIHKRVLGFVDPIAAGFIRRTQVYVGSFTPTAPENVYAELEELIEWLNDEETHRLDAVEVAAIAHYKLVFIHPFLDGNGRTSRLLMNFILMRAGFPPVIIPVEQRSRYYYALQQANEGDLRPFIRFIAEQTDRTLEGFISSTSSICELNNCAGQTEPPPVVRPSCHYQRQHSHP